MYVIVEWILEGLFNIISFKNIVSPRKEFDEYSIGDTVTANFQRKPFPAMIIAKSHDKNMLLEIMKAPETLKRTKESLECGRPQSKNQKERAEKDVGNTVNEKTDGRKSSDELQSCPPVRKTVTSPLPPTTPSRVFSQKTAASSTLSSPPLDAIHEELQSCPPVRKTVTSPLPPTTPSRVFSQKTAASSTLSSPLDAFHEAEQGNAVLKRIRALEDKNVDMEEEIKSLRRKVRKLEKKLEDNSSPSAAAPCSSPPPANTTPSATPSVPVQEGAHVVHSAGPQNEEYARLLTVTEAVPEKDAVKTLALHVFTAMELKNCSVTGKRSAKSLPGDARPPLDPTRIALMERVLKAKQPSLTRKDLVEKIQNIQKVLRRK